MKYLRLVLVVFVSATSVAVAQDEERRAPPVEIPDFTNLDEYIYIPRSTVRFGFRFVGGAKTSFSGQGSLASTANPGPETGANLVRDYHDGAVRPDSRAVARLDDSGNPVIDPQTGAQIFDPIAPDGRTNTWSYSDASQLEEFPGYVAFHSYSADVIDTTVREESGQSSAGLDISMSRDMGLLFGSRVLWTLTAGMSVNDISADTSSPVEARINTLTDFYSLFGRTPPDAPYSSPSSTTRTVVDANGNPVLNADGTVQTVVVDTSVLIGSEPAGRSETQLVDSVSVTNRWRLRGAYYTFRFGPTLWVPITARLRASVSAGAALVYAGSSYTVTQTFEPELGEEISDTNTSDDYKVLPGFYVDASLQYLLTDRAGFYAGAVFESAGDYTQTVESATSNYSTKIDFGSQTGVRAGMSVRF